MKNIFVFDEAYPFSEELALVRQKKWGFINKEGKIVIPCIYNEIVDYFKNGLCIFKNKNKYGVLNSAGKEILPAKYSEITFLENPLLIKVYSNKKYGLFTSEGKEICTNYDIIEGFIDGVAKVGIKNKYGFINLKGEEIISPQYDKLGTFMEKDPIWAEKSGKVGFIDQKGKEVIAFAYEAAQEFANGLTWVWKNGKCALINTKEEIKISFKYDWGGYIKESSKSTVVYLNRKCGIITQDDKSVTALKYDSIGPFNDLNIAFAKRNDKFGLINDQGKELTPFHYDEANIFHSYPFLFKRKGKWGMVDKSGNELSEFKYDTIEFKESLTEKEFQKIDYSSYDRLQKLDSLLLAASFKNKADYYAVNVPLCKVTLLKELLPTKSLIIKKDEKKKKYGFENVKGKLIIPCLYDNVYDFSEGIAPVYLNGKMGYIDEKGNQIIPCIFDEADSFEGGLACVKKGGKWGYINQKGENPFN